MRLTATSAMIGGRLLTLPPMTLYHQLAEANAAALERTMASGGTTVDVDTLDRALWKALKPARALTGRTPRRKRRNATKSRARAAGVYEELLAKAEARDNAASKRGRYRCLLRLGDLRRYGGDAKRATAWYERRAAREPGRGEAENGLGAVAQATGRPVTAAYLYWLDAGAAVQTGGAQFLGHASRSAGSDDEAASTVVLAFDGDAAAASARLADLRARKALSASLSRSAVGALEHAARRAVL